MILLLRYDNFPRKKGEKNKTGRDLWLDRVQADHSQTGDHAVRKGVGANHVVIAGGGGGGDLEDLAGPGGSGVAPENAGFISRSIWYDDLAIEDLDLVRDRVPVDEVQGDQGAGRDAPACRLKAVADDSD